MKDRKKNEKINYHSTVGRCQVLQHLFKWSTRRTRKEKGQKKIFCRNRDKKFVIKFDENYNLQILKALQSQVKKKIRIKDNMHSQKFPKVSDKKFFKNNIKKDTINKNVQYADTSYSRHHTRDYASQKTMKRHV